MQVRHAASLVTIALCAQGCGSMQPQPKGATITVTQVLDGLKDELALYAATTPAVPNDGPCHKNGVAMNLLPLSAVANLKTAASHEKT